MKILIPQALQRNVLAAVRSLSRAGHTIVLAYPTKKGSKQKPESRHVSAAYPMHSPGLTPEGFIDDLQALLKHEHFDVLLPFTHDAVLPISYYKEKLAPYAAIPIADYPILQKAHDKLTTIQVARQVGIGAPVTFCPASRDELLALRGMVPFPALVKARQGCGIGRTIRFARNFDELVEGYDDITSQPSNPPVTDFTRPLVQEYVPGPIIDGLFLYNHGSIRAAVTQDRTITYPANGGIGAVNTTTRNPELFDLGKRLLDAFGWHGPSQVEVKVDPRDGRYKIMEVNPKFWGTLACSLVAGVDFAHMAAEMAFEGDVEPCFDFRPGVTFVWLYPEATYAFLQHPNWKDFRTMFFRGSREIFYDWDWSDLKPDLMRAMTTANSVLFHRERILPYRNELEELALRQPPARQPEEMGL